MDLIVNGVATVRTSLGARRYYQGVMSHLNWPGRVEVTALPRWRRLERVDELLQRGRRNAVFWSPCQRGPIAAHNHVVTVLDCINVEYTYRGDWRLPLLRQMFQVVIDRAAMLVAISNATRDAVLRNYRLSPDKIIAIPGPVRFGDSQPAHPRPSHETDPFILMITNSLPHKNTAAAGLAIAASAAGREGIALRIVGSMESAGLAACRAAGVRVELHTGVSDAQLTQWQQQCRFLFSPSLDEGLNLPVAEALAQRANVLCSDVPVHREFYDGEVMFCDPRDTDLMSAAIDIAIGRYGRWNLGPGISAKPTFADIAQRYKALFMNLPRA